MSTRRQLLFGFLSLPIMSYARPVWASPSTKIPAWFEHVAPTANDLRIAFGRRQSYNRHANRFQSSFDELAARIASVSEPHVLPQDMSKQELQSALHNVIRSEFRVGATVFRDNWLISETEDLVIDICLNLAQPKQGRLMTFFDRKT